ncbi:MAG TPA: spore maturation protein [Firmicutes bacterium]|nr:spore maturation protein [Bacillota bacterium]
MNWISLVVPGMLVIILCYGLYKGVPVFDLFIEGARGGISSTASILPPLVALMTAISMFSASGALDALTQWLAPALSACGIPPELLPMILMRPISGSGSLALYEQVLSTYGPDSFLGRVASVLQGSTETTFYTIAVYYGAVHVSRTRHTLPAALTGDLIGVFASVLAVRIFFA